MLTWKRKRNYIGLIGIHTEVKQNKLAGTNI